ncbi:MAG: hypothetical protein OXB84_03435 [Halobacteriovoraceae bacterium]|nr:hypothetical protein [Halobacteriovoraceae bacterium]
MSEQNKKDLIHDINSAISALSGAFKIIGKQNDFCLKDDEAMLPLMHDKMETLKKDWRILKGII